MVNCCAQPHGRTRSQDHAAQGDMQYQRKQEVRMTGIIDYAHTETRSFADLPFNEIDA